jgi:fermentation-respiration switch protein FrsA (DUF1100 family)
LRKLLSLGIGLSLFVAALTTVVAIGDKLASPQPQPAGEPPTDLKVQSVLIPRNGNTPISGWYIDSPINQGAVLLLHGVRSNRKEMLERARFLNHAGYSTLLIDMQAHGETAGEHITFGFLESRDAHTALAWLKQHSPQQSTGVIGVSMGGAASLLGQGPLPADAIILESVYSSIDQAVENRLANHFGGLGRYLSPLLLWQLEPRLGISREALSPITAISQVNTPVMVISGTKDRHTLLYETKALYMKAPEPKELWLIEGAVHENLHRYAPAEYERRILAFFSTYFDK